MFDNLEIQTMKNILFVLTVFLFLSCSSDDSTAVRKITFKANGVYKVFEDIEVTYAVDNSWEVPFTRLDISANPIDGRPETFGLRVIRGGDYDGQSTNGGTFLDGNGYYFDFDHPIQMHLTTNNTKRMKGTFEGVFKDINGQTIQITEGRIDINYYPDNPQYIKK